MDLMIIISQNNIIVILFNERRGGICGSISQTGLLKNVFQNSNPF